MYLDVVALEWLHLQSLPSYGVYGAITFVSDRETKALRDAEDFTTKTVSFFRFGTQSTELVICICL